MNWISTKQRLPVKPNLKPYEQIPCLVVRNGQVEILVWNCEHICWDDSSGDDFACAASYVEYWAPLPEPPSKNQSITNTVIFNGLAMEEHPGLKE